MSAQRIMRSIERQQVWEKTGGACFYCGEWLIPDSAEKSCDLGAFREQETKRHRLMQIDHETPLRRGGRNSLANFRPSCRLCNIEKGIFTAAEYRQFLFKIGVAARFHDDKSPVRDWLLVATAELHRTIASRESLMAYGPSLQAQRAGKRRAPVVEPLPAHFLEDWA